MQIFNKKLVGFIAICFVLGSLIFLALNGNQPRFPLFEPGSYTGKLTLSETGSADKSGNKDFALFAVKDGDSALLRFVVADNEWTPAAQSNTSHTSSPMQLTFQGKTYILYGAGNLTEGFRGTVSTQQDDYAGVWELTGLSPAPQLNEAEVQALSDFLKLSVELEEFNSKIRTMEATVKQEKSEIARLTKYLTEGRALRENADRKVKEKKQELDQLYNTRLEKQKEAAQLRSKFEISQRLAGMGKLVYLSRNTLAYERQWYESMYKSAPLGVTSDFESLVARAERILTLKREIRAELDARNP